MKLYATILYKNGEEHTYYLPDSETNKLVKFEGSKLEALRKWSQMFRIYNFPTSVQVFDEFGDNVLLTLYPDSIASVQAGILEEE